MQIAHTQQQMATPDLTVEVDGTSPAEWSELLERFEDANIYQTWAYGAVSWGEKNLSHLVLKRCGVPAAMAQVRLVRIAGIKWGIAYLRWGPVCHLKQTDLDPGLVNAVGAALRAEYVQRRHMFLRVLPNAFFETPRAVAFQSAFADFRTEPFGSGQTYRTLVLDLAPPLEQLRKGFDQKWRNCLNRAEKNGLNLVEAGGADAFPAFIKIFDEMMARKKFETSTNIHDFSRMQAALPPGQRMKVLLCEHEHRLVAGLVGTAMGNSGIYLHGATSDSGMKLQGAYVLQWRMIQLLKETGIRYYNLGGINPETNPGVYHFKRGVSGQDVLYLPAFTACESWLSRTLMRVGAMTRGRLRKTRK